MGHKTIYCSYWGMWTHIWNCKKIDRNHRTIKKENEKIALRMSSK